MDVVNTFWTDHWSEFFTSTYSPPSMITGSAYPVGMYDGRTEGLSCGPTALDPNNAYYCGPPYSDFVGYDVNFLWKARADGDMFVYMIVAHEWGHAIQARLDSTLNFQAYELQADCFAGAALLGAVNDGTLKLETGDLKEVAVGLTDIADEGPWGKAGDHGSPAERLNNFNYGASNGPRGCIRT